MKKKLDEGQMQADAMGLPVTVIRTGRPHKLTVLLTAAEVAALREMAEGETVSSLVRRWIRAQSGLAARDAAREMK